MEDTYLKHLHVYEWFNMSHNEEKSEIKSCCDSVLSHKRLDELRQIKHCCLSLTQTHILHSDSKMEFLPVLKVFLLERDPPQQMHQQPDKK